jgi:Spy/CpxP family protein refolding chaperone
MNIKMTGLAAALLVAAALLAAPRASVFAEEGPGGKSRWGWAMKHAHEDMLKDLNLTGEQKKMLDENKVKHSAEMEALRTAMRETMAAMRVELQKRALDMGKVNKINDDLKRLHIQMDDRRLQDILAVRHILSPDQFRKFMDKMEKMGRRKDGRRGRP